MATLLAEDQGEQLVLHPGNEAIAEERGIPATFPRDLLDVMCERAAGGGHTLELVTLELVTPEGETYQPATLATPGRGGRTRTQIPAWTGEA